MGRFYKNEYLFSEIYLKEITKIDEDPSVLATLSALKQYREYADSTSLQACNSSQFSLFNSSRCSIPSYPFFVIVFLEPYHNLCSLLIIH